MRRISLHGEKDWIRTIQKTKDLSEYQSLHEAWQHTHTPEQIMESLSEISICNESIRLWCKHGWNLK